MFFNFHTHTTRCNHASGQDRDFIEAAIRAGYRELGFSDHGPYWFPTEYKSSYRIATQALPGYFASLLALKQEYADRITIHVGFETEYYPKCFAQMLTRIAPYPYEYLILGQHFIENEYDGHRPSAAYTEEDEMLTIYTDQVIEGLKTGRFSYLAHPDLLNYHRDDRLYRACAEKLCRAAKELGIPLEINFLGLREGRSYPSERFFEIAGEIGNAVIFGSDAHEPRWIQDLETEEKALSWCERFGLHPVEHLTLRLPEHKTSLSSHS